MLMATPMCSLACCCGRAESILAPQADSRKKSAPRQHHPLAPSSAPDAIAPTGPVVPDDPAPSARCASLSTCCPCFGARRAYSTPRPLSRVSGERDLGSAAAALPTLTGHPGRPSCGSSSLKEPLNDITRRLLCQVTARRLERRSPRRYLFDVSGKTPKVTILRSICQVV